MSIGQRIREERLKNNLSQEEVAKAIETTKQAIYKYENGIVTNIPTDKISKLAQLFCVTPSYLMGWETKNPLPKKGVQIPVLGNVAAGVPIEAIEDIEDYEEITEEMAAQGDYVALKIHGDSMMPRMLDGDVVIVRIQDTIENGETAIVLVNGGDATCKRVQKTPDGVSLISINPAYDPIFYSNKQIEQLPVRIFGKVVELRGKF